MILLHMLGALAIFGEGSFIFLWIALVIKSFEARCTFEEMVEKEKGQNMNVNPFTTKLG
jgi:hypothetical protein